MNVSRLVSLAAALVINVTVLAAFSSVPVHAQVARAVAAGPVVSAAPEAAVQEIVVTARRPS